MGIIELQRQIMDGPAWLKTVVVILWEDSGKQKKEFTNLYKE